MNPSTVSFIGVVGDQGTVQSPMDPLEKKPKKDKASTSKSKKTVESKSTTDSKIAELDHKWSDRFNHLEALLMAKTLEPTFSSSVMVTPTHLPPAIVVKDTEPFLRPTVSSTVPPTSSERTGKDFSLHQVTSQLESK